MSPENWWLVPMIHVILKCFFFRGQFWGDKPYNSVMYSSFIHQTYDFPSRMTKTQKKIQYTPEFTNMTALEKSHLPFFNRKYLLRVHAFNNWWEPSIQRSSDVKTNPTRGKLNPPHQLFALPTARKISGKIAIRISEVTLPTLFSPVVTKKRHVVTIIHSKNWSSGCLRMPITNSTAQLYYHIHTIYYHVFRNLLPLPSLCKLF